MTNERRRHKRFSATAFLNRPVYLEPLPPYFGHAIKGRLIDLSAGGMAILINELIPQQTKLNLTITFPDSSILEAIVEVKHAVSKGRAYLHGIEFLTLSPAMVDKIDRMSTDYIDCEQRVERKETPVCRADCAFFTMCSKPEKIEPAAQETALALRFKPLAEPEPLDRAA